MAKQRILFLIIFFISPPLKSMIPHKKKNILEQKKINEEDLEALTLYNHLTFIKNIIPDFPELTVLDNTIIKKNYLATFQHDHIDLVHHATTLSHIKLVFTLMLGPHKIYCSPFNTYIKRTGNKTEIHSYKDEYIVFIDESKPIAHDQILYDGPSDNNVWTIAYNNTNEKNNYFLRLIHVPFKKEDHTNILNIKPEIGIIKTLALHHYLNQLCYITKNETKNDTLNYCTFNTKKYEFYKEKIETNTFINTIQFLTNNAILLVSESGHVFKYDIIEKKYSQILIKNKENSEILIENMVQNQTVRYLWLLLSKTNNIYLMNLKNRKQDHITFSKIIDEKYPLFLNIMFQDEILLIKKSQNFLNKKHGRFVKNTYDYYKITLFKPTALQQSLDNKILI